MSSTVNEALFHLFTTLCFYSCFHTNLVFFFYICSIIFNSLLFILFYILYFYTPYFYFYTHCTCTLHS